MSWTDAGGENEFNNAVCIYREGFTISKLKYYDQTGWLLCVEMQEHSCIQNANDNLHWYLLQRLTVCGM